MDDDHMGLQIDTRIEWLRKMRIRTVGRKPHEIIDDINKAASLRLHFMYTRPSDNNINFLRHCYYDRGLDVDIFEDREIKEITAVVIHYGDRLIRYHKTSFHERRNNEPK